MQTQLPTGTRVSLRDDLECVTLVDAANNVVGSCGKLAAHREGKLHRAFSILITNPDGELLLQRRAAHKYHFANRWSNACCGHPRPGEPTPAAACRRLAEELGFTVPLTQVAAFPYFAEDAVSGLVENEYLHVFTECSRVNRPLTRMRLAPVAGCCPPGFGVGWPLVLTGLPPGSRI